VGDTILVTGAHGFIGRNVARDLAKKGLRVIAIGHGSWQHRQWREWGIADWYPADVNMETLVSYAGVPQAVIHCAGSGSVGFSVTHPHEDYRRTVDTTASLLEFLRLHAPNVKLVYPSSVAVYGNVQSLPITETDPIVPVSPYGVHKQMAEQLCASYARSFGLKVAIVRLFSVYGNGLRKQLLWDACSKISDGDAVFSGTGGEQRDWLHVEDAARLLAVALDHATSDCPVVNGGTGSGVTVAQVLREIVSAFGSGVQLGFSGQARSADPLAYVADISRARMLGWLPEKQWQQGVREYVDWFRAGAH
jgi:UDP-glucose 4-epimerase